jgi:hypothetical protein
VFKCPYYVQNNCDLWVGNATRILVRDVRNAQEFLTGKNEYLGQTLLSGSIIGEIILKYL